MTTVGEAHLAHFATLTDVADAKAEIFAGIEPDGVAVLNRDNTFLTGSPLRHATAAYA